MSDAFDVLLFIFVLPVLSGSAIGAIAYGIANFLNLTQLALPIGIATGVIIGISIIVMLAIIGSASAEKMGGN